MRIAAITLCREGSRIAGKLVQGLGGVDLFVHSNVKRRMDASRFLSIRDLTERIFGSYQGLVYIAPCGIVVRSIAPLIRSKMTDPAVVAVDAGGRYAISLLSGHEGGANELAFKVANLIGAEPVISTTTEAVKNLIVGIGCRRGTESDVIVNAVREGLRRVGARTGRVRVLASADIKINEPGLLKAADELGISVRFIASDEIRSTSRKFRHSGFVASKVRLPAVAEPSALLAGRRTQLILPKTIIHGVTVAIAREGSLS